MIGSQAINNDSIPTRVTRTSLTEPDYLVKDNWLEVNTLRLDEMMAQPPLSDVSQ